MDLYLLLNLSADCTPLEIEAARKRFCKSVTAFAPGLEITEENLADNFPEISQGFTILLNPASRAEYDKTIGKPFILSSNEIVGPQTEGNEQKLTFREWFNQASAYAAFLCLMLMAVLFLYMLAGYNL